MNFVGRSAKSYDCGHREEKMNLVLKEREDPGNYFICALLQQHIPPPPRNFDMFVFSPCVSVRDIVLKYHDIICVMRDSLV